MVRLTDYTNNYDKDKYTLLNIFQDLLFEYNLTQGDVMKVSYANGTKCCSWQDFAEIAEHIKYFQWDDEYGTISNPCDTSVRLVGDHWHSELNINHGDRYYNYLAIVYNHEYDESYIKPSISDLMNYN